MTDINSATNTAASVTTKVVEHGDASVLPETSWAWRRALIFLISITCLALAWFISVRVTDVGTLREIARNALWLVALCLFIYGAGATATDIVKLLSAARTTRREVITQGNSSDAT